MSSIKSVAVAGASGNLGPSIVEGLLKAGFSVTALTRLDSTSKQAAGVKVAPVDYASVESLTAALKGHDAVVSTLNTAVSDQKPLIDAAIAAGVQRFLPSEFGSDTLNENVRKSPPFVEKAKIASYLEEKAKAGKITYSLVITGPFLDWCLDLQLFANWKGGVTDVFDGGDREVSTTLLPDIGKAVAGVLKHPAETKNRAVYVQSAVITQNNILATVNKTTGKKHETRAIDSIQHEKEGYEALNKGDLSLIFNFLRRAIYGGPTYGAKMTKVDNDLVGVQQLSDKQLEEVVEKSVKKG